MPTQQQKSLIDPYAELSVEVRRTFLRDAHAMSTPDKLKHLLNFILTHHAVAPLLENAVYVVLNKPPLNSHEKRHFIAAMKLANVANSTVGFLQQKPTPMRTKSRDEKCDLVFFGPEKDAALKLAAELLWDQVWQEYWEITVEGQRRHSIYTWNQLLLKDGARPYPLGVCWKNHASNGDHPAAPYFNLHECHGLLETIGLPTFCLNWEAELLKVKRDQGVHLQNPIWLPDVDPLRNAFNKVDQAGESERHSGAVGWALFHLLRSYGIWGGGAFLSIPILIGARGIERTAVLSVCTEKPLSEIEYRQWRMVATILFRPLVESEMVAMIVNQDIATIAYSVGHALRPRLGALMEKLSTLRAEIARKFPDQPAILAIASQAEQFTSNCLGTANIMNFVAAFLHSQDGSAMKEEFFITEDYILSKRFVELAHACNQAQKYAVLGFDEIDLNILDARNARIAFSPNSQNKGRLFNPFYDELFFEIFFNAARYCSPEQSRLHIRIESAMDASETMYSQNVLVFGNIIRYPAMLKNYELAPGKWCDWTKGPHGGLRFMADCLRLTRTGNLSVRVVEHDNSLFFEVRIPLIELVLT